MPRPSRPRHWETRNNGGWHVKIRGKQFFLGKHPDGVKFDPEKPPQAILDAWHRLEAVELPASRSDMRVVEVIDHYLADLELQDKSIADRYRVILMNFANHSYRRRRIGSLLVNAEFDRIHFADWLANGRASTPKRKSGRQGDVWADGTKNNYGSIVRGVFKWAVGIKSIPIAKNPLAGYRLPPALPSVVVVSPEEFEVIRNYADEAWREFCTVIWLTGCRPMEAARIEARHVTNGVVILGKDEHKTWKATGRSRIIGLAGEAREIIEKRIAERPTGPVLLNRNGTKWTNQATCQRWLRLKELGKVRQEITMKAFRHSFATHNSVAGRLSDSEVSKCLGHVNTKQFHKTYDHSRANVDHVASLFAKAQGITS